MNKNQIALSSISMDLKRVALGYHRGSTVMAEKFLKEAIKRKDEIDALMVKPYVNKILANLDLLLKEKDNNKLAEDALMYSTLFQNASLNTKIS